jgi:hypothetical protein
VRGVFGSWLNEYQNLLYLNYKNFDYYIADITEKEQELVYAIYGTPRRWGRIQHYDGRKMGRRYWAGSWRVREYTQKFYIRQSDWAILRYSFAIGYRGEEGDIEVLKERKEYNIEYSQEVGGLLFPSKVEAYEIDRISRRYHRDGLEQLFVVPEAGLNINSYVQVKLHSFDTTRKSNEELKELYTVHSGSKAQIRNFSKKDSYVCGVAERFGFHYGVYNSLFYHLAPIAYDSAFWQQHKPEDLPPRYYAAYKALDALYPIEQQFAEHTAFNVDKIKFLEKHRRLFYPPSEYDPAYKMYSQCYDELYKYNPVREELYYYFLKSK